MQWAKVDDIRAMVSDLRNIKAIEDPARRARAAHDALTDMDDDRVAVISIRRDAVRELRDSGWTWQAVATLLDLHRNRAAHLLD